MPRPPAVPDFTPDEAKNILQTMIRERKIDATVVRDYQQRIQQDIQSLLQKARALGWSGVEGAAHGVASVASSVASSASAVATKAVKKQKANITPEQLASRQLQGRYLGLIRKIPAADRPRYQQVAKEKGREAAILEMADVLEASGGSSGIGNAGTGSKRRGRPAGSKKNKKK